MTHGEHIIQFYGDDEDSLAGSVASYLGKSLREGGAGLVIAAAPRREAIRRRIDLLKIVASTDVAERLLFLDDKETLGRFMRDGRPDRALFDSEIGTLARELVSRCGVLRAYGEMVGRLWSDRAYRAAIELEQLWNRLMAGVRFDLFCGYPIDVLGEEFQTPAMRPLLAEHSVVVPTLPPNFDGAMRRAMLEVLGESQHGVHAAAASDLNRLDTRLPNAEATILRLRSALPRYADAILAKAKVYARE